MDRGPEATPDVLALIRDLADGAAQRGIRYCHWKSNEALDRSLSADNDLDLLVERHRALDFEVLLAELGFVRARASYDRDFPGIVDFFGLDVPSGRIVHLQAHYQLVLGEPLIKNYHLPIEEALLEGRRLDRVLPTVAPEAELALFAIRMLLKLRARHLRHAPTAAKLRAEIRRTLDYLASRTRAEEASRFASEELPSLPPGWVSEAIGFLERAAAPTERAALARRLRAALAPYRRRGAVEAAWARISRRAYLLTESRRRGRPPRRTPAAGGLVVALLGGDGAGKSTAMDGLEPWLGRFLRVERFHLGKPPLGLLSRPVGALAGLGRRGFAQPGGSLGERIGAGPVWLQALVALQLWCLARDRLRAYRSLQRAARSGAIALVDRYPTPELSGMERPQIPELPRAPAALARAEAALHARIGPPDLSLVLRVPPDVAIRRKPEEAPEHVRRRAEEVWERCAEPRPGLEVLDAARPADEVQRELRARLWTSL